MKTKTAPHPGPCARAPGPRRRGRSPLAEAGLLKAGELLLLSRLLATPPDFEALRDAEALGLIRPGRMPDLEDIQVEFTRLLSAPGPDAVAANQSFYTDTLRLEPSGPDPLGCRPAFPGGEFRGRIGGESCTQAGHWYAAARFKPADSAFAMADHISTELAFLAHLHRCEAGAAEAGETREACAFRELRGEFHAKFLGRWAEEFGTRLSNNAVSEFYRRLGCRFLRVLREEGASAAGVHRRAKKRV